VCVYIVKINLQNHAIFELTIKVQFPMCDISNFPSTATKTLPQPVATTAKPIFTMLFPATCRALETVPEQCNKVCFKIYFSQRFSHFLQYVSLNSILSYLPYLKLKNNRIITLLHTQESLYKLYKNLIFKV